MSHGFASLSLVTLTLVIYAEASCENVDGPTRVVVDGVNLTCSDILQQPSLCFDNILDVLAEEDCPSVCGLDNDECCVDSVVVWGGWSCPQLTADPQNPMACRGYNFNSLTNTIRASCPKGCGDCTSNAPTNAPPSSRPTRDPTNRPTAGPTQRPTVGPTQRPTVGPTRNQTSNPGGPTPGPTPGQTSSVPTHITTNVPTESPQRTFSPTLTPTISTPSISPTLAPTFLPSARPTLVPTASPTRLPSARPTASPAESPTPTLSQSSSNSSDSGSEIIVAVAVVLVLLLIIALVVIAYRHHRNANKGQMDNNVVSFNAAFGSAGMVGTAFKFPDSSSQPVYAAPGGEGAYAAAPDSESYPGFGGLEYAAPGEYGYIEDNDKPKVVQYSSPPPANVYVAPVPVYAEPKKSSGSEYVAPTPSNAPRVYYSHAAPTPAPRHSLSSDSEYLQPATTSDATYDNL